MRGATADEIAKRPGLRGVPIIDRWVGIEYAVVPVPCNPQAEMQAVAKGVALGLIDPAELIAESSRNWQSADWDAARTALRQNKLREEIRHRVQAELRQAYLMATGRLC